MAGDGSSVTSAGAQHVTAPGRVGGEEHLDPVTVGQVIYRRLWRFRHAKSAYVDGNKTECQHMLTLMESALAITEAAAGSDPDTGLRAVAALRALTERLEILQVDNARTLGWSWQDIATRLGVTKQTVHRKHGKRTGRQ
jgi:hypothetical protein